MIVRYCQLTNTFFKTGVSNSYPYEGQVFNEKGKTNFRMRLEANTYFQMRQVNALIELKSFKI